MVGGIGVRDLPFFRLPTMCVARLDPETEKPKVCEHKKRRQLKRETETKQKSKIIMRDKNKCFVASPFDFNGNIYP